MSTLIISFGNIFLPTFLKKFNDKLKLLWLYLSVQNSVLCCFPQLSHTFAKNKSSRKEVLCKLRLLLAFVIFSTSAAGSTNELVGHQVPDKASAFVLSNRMTAREESISLCISTKIKKWQIKRISKSLKSKRTRVKCAS